MKIRIFLIMFAFSTQCTLNNKEYNLPALNEQQSAVIVEAFNKIIETRDEGPVQITLKKDFSNVKLFTKWLKFYNTLIMPLTLLNDTRDMSDIYDKIIAPASKANKANNIISVNNHLLIWAQYLHDNDKNAFEKIAEPLNRLFSIRFDDIEIAQPAAKKRNSFSCTRVCKNKTRAA